MRTRAQMLRPWLVATPAWWLTSVCCAVELFARLDVDWDTARDMAYILTAEMVSRGES